METEISTRIVKNRKTYYYYKIISDPRDLSAYEDLFSKKGIMWGIVGTNRTGKHTIALRLTKKWKQKNKNGKIICFDPICAFQKEGLADYVIDMCSENWAKELIKKDKKGKYKYKDSLLVINDHRILISPDKNNTPADVLKLIRLKGEIGMNIIFTTSHPSNILERFSYYITNYSILKTDIEDETFNERIPKYFDCMNAVNRINKYVDKHGRGKYPSFPHIVV